MRTIPTQDELERFKLRQEAMNPSAQAPTSNLSENDKMQSRPLSNEEVQRELEDFRTRAQEKQVSSPPMPTDSTPLPEGYSLMGRLAGIAVGVPAYAAYQFGKQAYEMSRTIGNTAQGKGEYTLGPQHFATEQGKEELGQRAFGMATVPMGGGPGMASGVRHGTVAKTVLGAGDKQTASTLRSLSSQGEKFYSPLERALETGQVGKLTIGENPKISTLQSTFKYATDKNIINKEELDYTGITRKLEELAKLGEERVSRNELLGMARERSLKETGEPSVLGGINPKLQQGHDRLERLSHRTRLELEEARYRNDLKYGAEDALVRRLARREAAVDLGLSRLREKGSESSAHYGPDNYSTFNLPGHIPGTYQERLFHFTPEGELKYMEPHDGFPLDARENAFMFTRGHDRKLPNGETSKHLDEIQSSLHQKAMEEGYATGQKITELPRGYEINPIKSASSPGGVYYEVRRPDGVMIASGNTPKSATEAALDFVNSQAPQIPRAPFSDLKWAKLGLKEWVDTAIKEGKDSVTWSTGRIVADRYNKLANSFNWTKDLKTGKYLLHFETPSGRTFDQGYVNMKQLRDNAGKNVARIVEEQEKIATEASRMDVVSYKRAGETFYAPIDRQTGDIFGEYRTREAAQGAADKSPLAQVRHISGDGASGDFLVGGKFFEKVYDEYAVREMEKEYGVRPHKIKVPTEAIHKDVHIERSEVGEGWDVIGTTQDGKRVHMAPTYLDRSVAEDALRVYNESFPGVEVWHLPLKDIAPRVLSEGQRIAMGSTDVATALRTLAVKDAATKQSQSKAQPRDDDYATRSHKETDTSATHDSRPPSESGKASWYGKQFHGKKMSNKQKFDMNKLTAAHRKLPFGTKVRVTDKESGKHVDVTITDRGPYKYEGRTIDLSKKAADKLGITKKGLANVRIEVIEKAKENPPSLKVAEK